MLPLPPASTDKSEDWQLELLMEKLRSKESQFKTFAETSKNVRMAMLVSTAYGVRFLPCKSRFFRTNATLWTAWKKASIRNV